MYLHLFVQISTRKVGFINVWQRANRGEMWGHVETIVNTVVFITGNYFSCSHTLLYHMICHVSLILVY